MEQVEIPTIFLNSAQPNNEICRSDFPWIFPRRFFISFKRWRSSQRREGNLNTIAEEVHYIDLEKPKWYFPRKVAATIMRIDIALKAASKNCPTSYRMQLGFYYDFFSREEELIDRKKHLSRWICAKLAISYTGNMIDLIDRK